MTKENQEIFLNSILQKAEMQEDGLIIYGIGSAEVIDSQNEIVKINAIKKSLPQLLKRQAISFEHRDAIVGKILEEHIIDNQILKTKVDYPNDYDVEFFKTMGLDLERTEEYLFVLAKIFNDNQFNKSIITKISEGIYNMFSIAGHKLKTSYFCDKKNCYTSIDDLTLDAVTITKKGANPLARFKNIGGIVMKSDEEKVEVEQTIEPETEIKKSEQVEETVTIDIKEFELLQKKFKELEGKVAEFEKPKETVKETVKETPKVEEKKEENDGYKLIRKEDLDNLKKEIVESLKPKEIKKEAVPKTELVEEVKKSTTEEVWEKMGIIAKFEEVQLI